MMKYRGFLLIVFACLLIVPFGVEAKTLADVRGELAKLEKEKKDAENKSAELQKEIDNAKAEINEITRQTADAIKKQNETKEEIKELGEEIDGKEEEIKDLVSFYQISDSENFYLKFIFGAESFEDFIYRFSVAEQLTDANDKLVEEMNGLVKENEKKVKELEKQEKELDALNDKMKKQVVKLTDERGTYLDSFVDIESEIKSLKKTIKTYEDAGCGENEQLSVCLSSGSVPYDFGFAKPLKSGFVSYEFGVIDPYYSIGFHKGMDIGGNAEGTPIYAVAAGRVAAIFPRQGCGGNMVFINHTVNGKDYTSGYYHMLSIGVSVGEIVSKGQQVGTVGGGGSTWWDSCSFGAHLHLDMVYGHYYVDYFSFSEYVSNVFNPRNLIYFPNSW